MRVRLVVLASTIVLALLIGLLFQSNNFAGESPISASGPPSTESTLDATKSTPTSSEFSPTAISAHNLMLRKGPHFRIYVRWLRGQMVRTRRDVNPTFDDPESFFLNIKAGIVRANIGDIGNFLNAGGVANSPLKNIMLLADGDQVKLKGTVHKLISFPVEVKGTIAAASDNRIQIHITKISVLKVPFKGLLGGLHIKFSDLVDAGGIAGIQISGNDIFFDTLKLLPPPHIHGDLTAARVVSPDIEEVFGDAQEAATRVEQWRNFLKLSDGTIDFGKLTMRHVDLIMVDLSNAAWFDLDLNHYQDQLVNGYTRMTPGRIADLHA
jgi:hypothetical protein